MTKKALITGISGQDGPYLAKLLLEKGYKVHGLLLPETTPDFRNCDYLDITDKIEFTSCDLTDEDSVRKLIVGIEPDELYNLAGISFIPFSWEKPKLTTEVNSLGVLYLLDALRSLSKKVKFFQASTSTMFGDNHKNGFQTEETPFDPKSPYAISKLYSYFMVLNYRKKYDLFGCNGILYNHESPLRGVDFVTRKISDGIAKIKLGLTNEIRLGNLESKRDWGFAGDFVEAMWLMLQQDNAGDYVLATGELHSIREFLKTGFEHVGIKDWERYIVKDEKFFRPEESVMPIGKPEKAKIKLGWQPKTQFDVLVKMMVDADLSRVTKNN